MRKRPLALFGAALLFLYLPAEYIFAWIGGKSIAPFDFFLSVICPVLLLVGLIHVTRVGWYTLVALIALWGVRDLYEYYASHGTSLVPLLVHLCIYCFSLGYFINPRIRPVYFDPKLRWWRSKRRYETHMAFLMHENHQWHYPILRNISEGGCFVETQDLLELNAPIDVTIPLPAPLNVSVIKARGEVRWISTNPHRTGMGVEFINPPPQYQRALKEFVQNQL